MNFIPQFMRPGPLGNITNPELPRTMARLIYQLYYNDLLEGRNNMLIKSQLMIKLVWRAPGRSEL